MQNPDERHVLPRLVVRFVARQPIMIADVDFGLVRCLDYGKEFSARPLEANGLYIAIRNYLFSSISTDGDGVFAQNQRDWFFGMAIFKSIFHKSTLI